LDLEVIIASSAAFISAVMALISWWYNRELSKGTVGLTEVKVTGSRDSADSVKIDFLYLFKNTGRETIRLTDLRLGHFDFNRRVFQQASKKVVANKIHGGSIFNYNNSLEISLSPDVSDEEIPHLLPRFAGKHALIIRLTYQGDSLFSRKEKCEKYFLGYEGRGGVYQLTMEEYEDMESGLPSEFKKDD
jgi:hypothetical protein